MSWAPLKLAAKKHGTEGMVLLFADTKMEDEDLYRFLDQAAANVGAPLVRIADGRNPTSRPDWWNNQNINTPAVARTHLR